MGVAIGGFSGGLPVLYGTTEGGGKFGKGTVFALVPPQTPGGTWSEFRLHDFHGTDGDNPLAPLVVDLKSGTLVLYGTTVAGGASAVNGNDGSGTIFSVTPPTTPGGTWTESVLYSFGPGTAGQLPNHVALGHGPGGAPVLYGFTVIGGANAGGVVYSLAEAGGTWTYNVIYNLPPSTVISAPTGLTIGNGGVLYGTAAAAFDVADSAGLVYSLTPPTSEGGSWTANTLYAFGAAVNDGSDPQGGVVVGSNGSLYGVTSGGGLGDGTVYSLTPPASPGGAWTEDVIYSFPFNGETSAPTSLVVGPHGVLYGTTQYGVSTVFAIEP